MPSDVSLASWVHKQPGLLPLPTVVWLVHKAAETLQELHNQQMVYQDVNPANLLIHAEGGKTNQLELGLADLVTSAHVFSRFDRNFPANSQPLYMAPEQWIGQAVLATDQYALAVMAYELLTGLAPFQGPPAQLMHAHLTGQPPAPSTFDQRLSPAIDAVILHALAKRPEDRFPSISAFASAFEQAMQHPESVIVSVPRPTGDGELHATLPISRAEAATGTLRTITLPEGQRVTVSVPKGAYDGQIIRLERLGEPSALDDSVRIVLLTIAVTPTETRSPAPAFANQNRELNTPISAPLPSASSLSEGDAAAVPKQAFPSSTPRPVLGQADAAGQVKRRPFSRSSTLRRSKRIATRAYSTLAVLSPVRKGLLLGSIVLIILLISFGLFSLIQANAGVPIPYPPHSGFLAMSDTLRDNSGGYNWPEGISSDGSLCQFTQRAYHVAVPQAGAFHYCVAGATRFSNFVYEARMMIVKGDQGGLIFRADGASGKFYYFRVGRDGSYALYLYADTKGTHARVLASGLTPAVHTGLNIANVLAVVARDETLDLYVNQQHISSVRSDAYSSGQIGVTAAYATEATEVTFSNVKVWTL